MATMRIYCKNREHTGKVAEILTALAFMRYDAEVDYGYSSFYKHSELLKTDAYDTEIGGDIVTVELMNLITEFKEVLGIEEVYFEADDYDGRNWEDWCDIDDKALWNLYHEEPHDRHTKISA